MIDTPNRAGDTLPPFRVTSLGRATAETTVVTRTTFRNGEGPRGEPGAFDAAERKELKAEIRLVSWPTGSRTPETPTILVMRGNAAFSVTARSDKRTLVTLWCCRVSRDVCVRTRTR